MLRQTDRQNRSSPDVERAGWMCIAVDFCDSIQKGVGSIVKSDGSLLQLYRFQLRCGDCLRGRVMGAMKHLAADKRWEAGGSQYLTISRAPSSRDSHLFVAPARSTWR